MTVVFLREKCLGPWFKDKEESFCHKCKRRAIATVSPEAGSPPYKRRGVVNGEAAY